MKALLILISLALLTMGGAAQSVASATQTPAPAAKPAAMPSFVVPLACALGSDCWVMNYLDLGPKDDGKAIDPMCGARTFDGSKGTVFALRDLEQMKKGVNVLAAQDGTVKRVRSAEPDGTGDAEELKKIQEAKKECGNAVLIDHGNNLQTIYCHMKKDSITVKDGDVVRAGDAIGQVGLSGYTKYPQLHFGVLWNERVIDPFTSLSSVARCGSVQRSLWKGDKPPVYEAAAFYNAGFSGDLPTLADVDSGKAAQTLLRADIPVLTFWATLFGVQPGDTITLKITAPDGQVFSERTIAQENSATRQLYYTGRKFTGKLKNGNYKGTATLSRTLKDGTKKTWDVERSVTISG